MISSRN